MERCKALLLKQGLSDAGFSRVIEMTRENRTPFEVIAAQF